MSKTLFEKIVAREIPAQIIYEAVWADPSDPTKTYTNAASALLSELRKRSGVSTLLGPFQPRGN